MANRGRPSGESTRNRRAAIPRVQNLVQVAILDRRGYDRHEIAARLGISEESVIKSIDEIHAKYMSMAIQEKAMLIEEKRAQLRELRKEAWEAWERSKADGYRKVTETRPGAVCPLCLGEGKNQRAGMRNRPCTRCGGTGKLKDSTRITKVREGRLPANEYLKTIIETLRDEQELLGLTSASSSTQVNIINWDTLLSQAKSARQLESGGTGDVIASKLHAIEARLVEETGGKGGNGNGSSEQPI
jgi:predicted DNA-binding protein (UPF0251 family)